MSDKSGKSDKNDRSDQGDRSDEYARSAPDSPLAALKDRRIILTVTGGIAAYKAAELSRLLVKSGALVRVVMTEASQKFVTPLTFSSLTGGPVATDLWENHSSSENSSQLNNITHVAWSQWAEAIATAPATADFLAKLAHGLADDLASATALAFNGPRLVAPAMNTQMYLNQATVDNLELLRRRGYRIASGSEGLLACGTVGKGRMASVWVIAMELARLLSSGPLKGKKVVVTGGATREPWDDIRFLSNRSSGLMGLALAQAAWLMGADVTYISGPAAAEPPETLEGLRVMKIGTTQDLYETVEDNLEGAWALVMNAAPADFRPKDLVRGKISKSGQQVPSLVLARTVDILSSLKPKKGNTIFVGFAAEEDSLIERAKEKLKRKNLDYIAANQAGGSGSAFGSESISLNLLSAKGSMQTIGPTSKFQASWLLWERVLASEQ
ncbi:MAG: bifunctional phosphopantothenoylcysteine decarboxylase/phosphopantothenate--cysteine ligase CoaBC [Deltaproteobacteria bacterium]|jgi:phosphopantothenoylcysteine decarboxylase/phosphopantothenate--cysteine ligase|nr:bifunctional phosphopantothenoylcysteine decarboxylase/phosphopantothenate--cysteine ligase CoaBC [Deltaproteobacteria bacterium]